MFVYFAFNVFFQNTMKNLKILNMLTCYQKRGYYKMPVTSLSQIKSDFQHFKGGSIDLTPFLMSLNYIDTMWARGGSKLS